jgi:hypothetical protein
MVLIDLLNRELEELAAAEPKPEKEKRVAFRDPLARFPLGKQEIADAEEDSPIGKMLTRNSWRGR